MAELFDEGEIAKLVGISESQVRYWSRTGLIPPAGRQGGKALFDFKALVAFRTVRRLREEGISVRRIRGYMEALKRMMPDVDQPLAEVSVSVVGRGVVFSREGVRIDPRGQLILDFSPRGETPVARIPSDSSEELFFQGLGYEEEGRWEGAKECYLRLLEADPQHVDAMVNLGTVEYRLGERGRAEALYRRALRVDPDHPEANYNLANVLEEKGDLENALLFYKKAVHADPSFADAHFNLARLLERMGEVEEAKGHWRAYLELDPESEWASYARGRIEEE